MDEETKQNEKRKREDGTPGEVLSGPQATEYGQSSRVELSSSPVGSFVSRSSSLRSERVVELLYNNDEVGKASREQENWMIGEEFYREDVAASEKSSDSFADIENHDDNSDVSALGHQVVALSDADSTDDDDYIDSAEEVITDGSGHNSDDDENDVDMGFEIAPNEQDRLGNMSSQSDSDDDVHANAVQYDTSLPIEHRYLGGNLEESRCRRILDDNSFISLPLLNLKHIVLLPGQVLPITTGNLNSSIHLHLQNCITRGNRLIGLMSSPRDHPFGTTAEIRSYANDQEEDQIKIILEGRQRFKLISAPFETAIEGTVMVLPEITLGRPYPKIPSWNMRDETRSKYIISRHPKWLVRNREAKSVAKKIAELIKDWCIKAPIRDPNDFGYWVASNLPISNIDRMKVLQFDCTESRLSWLLGLLEKSEFLGCSSCRNVICHRKDFFLMSCSGPQNSFVNPAGYIHDTLTVNKANGLIYEYQWSTEFTWFPGYAWKAACCALCSRHIGWCYKSTEPDTKPRRFWGLSRASIRLQSNNMIEDEETNSSQEIMDWL